MPRRNESKKQTNRRKQSGRKPSRRPSEKVRLQRVLAAAGFGSRRQCEELIESGRVDVDGDVVTKLGTTVDPATAKVRVDGVLLKKQKLVYFAVNKPIGVVTTNRDPHGRPRVIDLVPPDERVFPVGRLDRNSEGLILLTNDGELAQRLTHPKFGVRKVYRVTVAGKVDTETMRQMRKGIYLAEGHVRVEGAKLLKSRSRSTEMEIVLREGKNREIRRILARLGHKVQLLRRIAVGPLRLGDLPQGAYRVLRHQEIEKLWAAAESHPESSAARPRRGSKKVAKKTAISRSAPRPAKAKRKKRSSKDSLQLTPSTSPSQGTIIGADPGHDGDRVKRKRNQRGSKKKKQRTQSSGRDAKPSRSKTGQRGASRKTSRKKASNKKLGAAKRSTGAAKRGKGSRKRKPVS